LLDSGVGGLTVVKEIFKQLPQEKIVYFGDTAHFPYGPRSQIQVRGFVYDIIDFLLTQEIKMIIVACNSAAAAGFEYYKERVNVPLLGVIEPGVRVALQHTRTNKIGVIGTTGTIESGAYQQAFNRLGSSGIQLFSHCSIPEQIKSVLSGRQVPLRAALTSKPSTVLAAAVSSCSARPVLCLC